MICSKCHNSAVVNQANGKDFYFCQTCRIEVGLEDKPDYQHIKSFDSIDDFYREWKGVDEPGTVSYSEDEFESDDDDWYSGAPGTPHTLTQDEIDQMFQDLEQEGTDRD